jgi:hypothetical protein
MSATVVTTSASTSSTRDLSRLPAILATAFAAVLLLAPSLLLGTLPSNSSSQNLTWAEQFSEQFRTGILYPRWMPESFDGLGGPAFYFYPPLPFWIDALLSVFTGNVLSVSWRLSIAFALLLGGSGLAMHAWLRSIVGRRTAMIGALAYMAAPYHLFDHYIRGAYAEFAAYAVLPLVILGIGRMAGRQRGGIALLAVAYAALALSHLPTALLISVTAVPCYVLFCAWRIGDRQAIRFLLRCAVAGVLGLGLAAIYLVPALSLQDDISAEQLWMPGYRVDTWFLLFMPKNLIRSDYVMLIVDSISAACVLAAVGVMIGLLRGKEGAGQRREAAFWASLCLACLLLMSGLVPWFWEAVPLVWRTQFPWRLLMVVEFAMVTALCLMPWATLDRSARLVFAAAMIALVPAIVAMVDGTVGRIDLALNGEILPPQDVKEYLPAGYPQRSNTAFNDLGLEPLKELPPITCTPLPRLCRADQERFGAMRIEVESDEPIKVVVRRFFFPAWRVDPTLPIAASEPLRLVSFVTTPGRHTYRLQRAALPQEEAGWGISGLSLLLLLASLSRPFRA